MIKQSRYLSSTLKNVIDKIIQINGYFAHPENLLLAMLGDQQLHVRELALRHILKSRSMSVSAIRKFRVPKINFNANDYIEIIEWQTFTLTESPLTKKLSTKELKEMIVNVPDEIKVLKFPCHS